MGVRRTYRLNVLFCILLITMLYWQAQAVSAAETINIDEELRTGTCVTLQAGEGKSWGETKWQVANPAILRLDRTTGNRVRVYPVKAGKTTVIARMNDTTLIYRVNVTAGTSLEKSQGTPVWKRFAIY
ncbi:MAG: hypothetical protein Q4F41_10170 [Eubacteriales bacterium]|nr:hypothetical protein [Eubacteriales bacterium]